MVTGDRLGLALPEPPTYCWKLVTSPPDVLVAGLDEEADGAGLDAGALVAGALVAGALLLLELELELELQAVIPASKQAANAIVRRREPITVHRRIAVTRIIAPLRLSAV